MAGRQSLSHNAYILRVENTDNTEQVSWVRRSEWRKYVRATTRLFETTKDASRAYGGTQLVMDIQYPRTNNQEDASDTSVEPFYERLARKSANRTTYFIGLTRPIKVIYK